MTTDEFDLYIQDDEELLEELFGYANDEILKYIASTERNKNYNLDSINYSVYNFEVLDECYILMITFYAECHEIDYANRYRYVVDGEFDFTLEKNNRIFDKIRRNDKIDDILN